MSDLGDSAAYCAGYVTVVEDRAKMLEDAQQYFGEPVSRWINNAGQYLAIDGGASIGF